jgi:uncharacterized membrane protein YedE/YeeE
MRFEVGKDVELSVSYPLNVLDLEEMVSSSPKVPKASLFHVIFDLNGVFMATCFKTILKGSFGPNIEDFPFHFVPLF